MARGNDADAAQADLTGQYGEHPNAEALIAAHDDRYDSKLNAALQKPVDTVATDALDLRSIKPQHKGGEIKAAAIRGGRLIVVEEVDGELVKWHDDVPGSGSRSSAKAAPDKQPSSQSADPDAAPENVKGDVMKAKLAELNIEVPSSARAKKDWWALVPDDAKAELQTAADAEDAKAAAEKAQADADAAAAAGSNA